jgi:tRNA N6-adenosine threonylcarbamoyltransferase
MSAFRHPGAHPIGRPIVLGIESSCDETAVALVRAPGTVLAQSLASQAEVHEPFGGVVPEIASRRHIEVLDPLVTGTLAKAGLALSDVDAVAVTAGPGLIGAVLVGVSYAKALAWALEVPFVGVHHLEAHVAAAFLAEDGAETDLTEPFVALVVSGGHTSLYRVDDGHRFTTLGATVDDAAGEALDKGAKMLGLPYPGGPALERLAAGGDPARVAFPRAFMGRSDAGLDFSFSGVKTALRTHLAGPSPAPAADLAASYQEAVMDVLSAKAVRAAVREGVRHLALVGGVAANGRLRALLAERARAAGLAVRVPPPALCTDNAVMVAAAGARMLAAGGASDLSLDARARAPLTGDPLS